jgi:hypothetical protein
MSFDDILAWDQNVTWPPEWVAVGDAQTVVNSLRSLWYASNDEEATVAYWGVDNVVVVQGTVYPAAGVVSEVLVRMVAHGSSCTRRWALELLLQLCDGWPLPNSAPAAASMSRCSAALSGSIEVMYSLLTSHDSGVRLLAAEVVKRVDQQPERLKQRVGWVRDREADVALRAELARVLDE